MYLSTFVFIMLVQNSMLLDVRDICKDVYVKLRKIFIKCPSRHSPKSFIKPIKISVVLAVVLILYMYFF